MNSPTIIYNLFRIRLLTFSERRKPRPRSWITKVMHALEKGHNIIRAGHRMQLSS